MSLDSVALCVETFGRTTDPVVLLIGGAHCSMDWWHAEFCHRLAWGGRHVIRYDRRATGESSTDPAGALQVDQVHLVGASLGGAIAQRLAIEEPERCKTITLVASSRGLRPASRPDPGLPPMSPTLLEHFTWA